MQAQEGDLRALMIASLDGDAAAYRVLLETVRWRMRLYFQRRLSRDTAEVDDLVQETLIAIHTRRGTYDRSQEFTAWIFAIARYKLVDHFRRSGRRRSVPLDDATFIQAQDESSGTDAAHDLENLLRTLPAATQALIRDIKVRGCSHAEAADARGISETAAKVAVHRGLKKLSAYVRNGMDAK